MPADEAQLANEGITEPHPDEIRKHLQQLGLEGEANVWQDVWYPLSTAAPLSAR
jgi:signal recognition particle subunit SEC65